MSKRKLTVALLGLFICSILLLVPVQPVKAQFVLASWDYSGTEYGQGIKSVSLVWANGTTYDNCGWFHPYSEFEDFEYGGEWFYNTSLIFAVGVYLNGTLTGVGDWETGLNHVRLNLIITFADEVVFSKENLTYSHGLGESLAPNYYYVFNTTVNCFNTVGIYTALLTYEVFY